MIRWQLKLSQKELAELLGVSNNTVYRWEAGIHAIQRPTARLLNKILDERGCQ